MGKGGSFQKRKRFYFRHSLNLTFRFRVLTINSINDSEVPHLCAVENFCAYCTLKSQCHTCASPETRIYVLYILFENSVFTGRGSQCNCRWRGLGAPPLSKFSPHMPSSEKRLATFANPRNLNLKLSTKYIYSPLSLYDLHGQTASISKFRTLTCNENPLQFHFLKNSESRNECITYQMEMEWNRTNLEYNTKNRGLQRIRKQGW